MTKWYLYKADDGLFTGRSIDCPPQYLEVNVKEGEGCILGPVDPFSQRVDMATGELVDYQPPQPSANHTWDLGSRRWVYVPPLEEVQAAALVAIDMHADAARLSVVGDAARIKEYERAQQHAEAYRDAGYTGDVPPSVACWASVKGWAPREACDDILAAANRWLTALDTIRALRLRAKEDVRLATDASLVAAIVEAFADAVAASVRTDLIGS